MSIKLKRKHFKEEMSLSETPLIIETSGHVQQWTINLPDSRNPISEPGVIDALEDAVAGVKTNREIRAVVLTGAGKAFSAGGNVKDMADKKGMFAGSPDAMREGYRNGIQRIPLSLYYCEIPVIAAVNGPAIGAGCDLALMCDLRVASTTAFFAESFVKLGIVPGDGGAWLLPRIVGNARAAEMALTGDRVDAATALDWGLVSQVVEPEDLLSAAHALAERVAVNPPHSVRMTKRLLRLSESSSLEALLEHSAAMQAIAHHTDDHREAIDAMLGKRDAQFEGH